MYLLLDQLVYTSFAERGFSTLASAQVSVEIQQAFMQRVAQYWDSYNPPATGYRAVYLYQLSPEQTLFGWLYNDGFDDVGRSDVPLFVCYYLTEPLFEFQLANIFTCLEKGPVALIDRHNPSAWLETKVIPNLWSYQPARQGVAIGLAVRQRSYSALQQGELLDMFVCVYEQETVVDLNGQTYEQQMAILSIYTTYVINGLNLPTADVNLENAITNQTTAIQSYQSYKQKLQPYKQVLAKRNQLLYPPTANTHSLVVRNKIKQPIKWNGQKVADNTAKNIYNIKAKQPAYNISSKPNSSQTINKTAKYDSVLAYQKTQLLLKIGIAASVLALAVGIYGLHQASVSNSNYRDSISWAKGSVV
jgi:phosphate transport system substrate-binding protein